MMNYGKENGNFSITMFRIILVIHFQIGSFYGEIGGIFGVFEFCAKVMRVPDDNWEIP